MMRLRLFAGLLAALLVLETATAHIIPPRRSRADADNFVAVGTNDFATALLQHYVDVDANIAFSPLGLSALLAILAEGAQGETRQQLVAALHLPEDREAARSAYKQVLTRLKDKHELNRPEFRNWFYIYRNYTVEKCFQDVLEQNYLTEVRDVDNPNKNGVTEESVDSSTETIIVHKPLKIENTGVKIELPEVSTDEPETTSVNNELLEVDVTKAEAPVKGEGLDPYNLPADLHPLAQVPIAMSSFTQDKDEKEVNVIQPALKPSQEDSIRTIMVQEAVVMEEALKEHEKNKTLEYVKDREEEMKEALEKDVVNKEQMSVDIQEQIETEKELQNAIEDKINKQEVIKEVLEINMNKEEEAIENLKEDIEKVEKGRDDTGIESLNMAVMPDMMNGGQIKVAVVVMNDEEVKQDGVDYDKDEKTSLPFKDVSVFDPSTEVPNKDKETTGVSFIDISITSHPQHNHTPSAQETSTTPQVPEGEEEAVPLERKSRSTQDITNSFSGNNLVSRTSGKKNNEEETLFTVATSMMIIFNALYFKGAWKVPFVPQSKDGAHSFYTSDTEKVPVSMMHAEGSFNIGKIAELDSVAIDIPYEGGRYSLLVVLPNSRSGLRKLIADLGGRSLCELSRGLTPQPVELCLPSFEVQTTTKPISALSKFGVSHVFKDTADLSGISPVHGLFVQDMSQLVTLSVDLSTSSTNFLTASSEAATTRGGGEKFVADRPFLYFVHDVVDNLIVVAGKVTNPNTAPEE